MFHPEIQLTADGSHTLFIPEMDEHYHSINGAVQESMHVFIEAGLKQCSKNEIRILELGFGTGLNAFLSYLETENTDIRIHYTGLEKYPLPIELIKKMNYRELYSQKGEVYLKFHRCSWNIPVRISSCFILEKIKVDFSDFDFTEQYDIVYYDAFAPDKQTKVWTQEIFDKLFASMNSDGILTTYCAKGNVRRMMIQSGFEAERIPGPPGKRQMLRAKKYLPDVHCDKK